MKPIFPAIALLALAAAPAARAGGLAGDYRACHETCDAIADECQYLNDVDTCERSRLACSRSCDERYETFAVCVDQCDGLLRFCRQDGASTRAACADENDACVARCEHQVVTLAR